MINSLTLALTVIVMMAIVITWARILQRIPSRWLGYGGWLLGMAFGTAPFVLVQNGIIFQKTGENVIISGIASFTCGILSGRLLPSSRV